MKLKAANGIYLVKPLEDDKTSLVLTSQRKSRILKGEIIDVGLPAEQKAGGILHPQYKKGVIIWFLSYEGNYDLIEYGNDKYYAVLFEDVRGWEEK